MKPAQHQVVYKKIVLVKRFGEHVATVVVHSRGLESHVNRLIQSHPSDVGVDAGGGDSSASNSCTAAHDLHHGGRTARRQTVQ